MRKWLFVVVLVALLSLVAGASDTLDVYFINVGHGDAILVDCGPWEMLIDAGGPTRWCKSVCETPDECGGYCIGRHMDFLTDVIDGELELAILTHNHEDHFGGFGVVFDLFEPTEFYNGEMLDPNDTADSFDIFIQRLEMLPILLRPVSRGDRFTYGDLLITVLNPAELGQSSPDRNNNSLVLLLEYGDVAFLFTGDIQTPAESVLQSITLSDRCLVLKVAHHGSDSSTSSGFLEWADPELAIVSCDDDDMHATTIANLGKLGIPYLTTHANGTICVSTGGNAVWVTTNPLLFVGSDSAGD